MTPTQVRTILEKASSAFVLIDANGDAAWMNQSAKSMLQHGDKLPPWIAPFLDPMRQDARQSGMHSTRHWSHQDMMIKASCWPVDQAEGITCLELTAQKSRSSDSNTAENLMRAFALTTDEANILGGFWKGLSNQELCTALNVPIGTIKSRAYRLYKKLGVKRRSCAVRIAHDFLSS